jgi:hypothetical protein
LYVSAYYTKLKGLRDELLNYRSIPKCSCGSSNKAIQEHNHQDYVIQFLVGLNGSFAHIRGQIMLLYQLSTNSYLLFFKNRDNVAFLSILLAIKLLQC